MGMLLGTAGSPALVSTPEATLPADTCLAHMLKAETATRIPALAGPYTRFAIRQAQKYRLPRLLVAAVIRVENRGFLSRCAGRVSSAGAIGPMQLEPATAWQTLRVNPWRPHANIRGGARYLARLYRRFRSWKEALEDYHAGPTQVSQGSVPRAARIYAQRVLRLAQVAAVA